MKTTRHSLLAKGLLVLLSLLILVFVFTYSWFAPPNLPTDSTGIAISTETTQDFEYAIGFYNSQTLGEYVMTNFTNSSDALNLEHLTGSDGETYNLLADYKPIDVTGDGATLIRPKMSYGNSLINTSTSDYSLANPNVQYINFDLFFRSTASGVSINLADGSYAKGACEKTAGNGALTLGSANVGTVASPNSKLNIYQVDGTNVTPAEAYNASSYGTSGSFSKDAIVGAVRVAFVPYDYDDTDTPETDGINSDNVKTNTESFLSGTASLLWLPRPDIKLSAGNTNASYSLLTGISSSSHADASYTYNYDGTNSISTNTYTHTYYKIFKGASNSANHIVTPYSNTVTPTTLSDGSREFASITSSVPVVESGTTYYYTKVNVRIWVEGTDLESRRALSGGKFLVNFKLNTD